MFRFFFILFQVSSMTNNRRVAHYSIPEYFAQNVDTCEPHGLYADYI